MSEKLAKIIKIYNGGKDRGQAGGSKL